MKNAAINLFAWNLIFPHKFKKQILIEDILSEKTTNPYLDYQQDKTELQKTVLLHVQFIETCQNGLKCICG